MIRFPWVAALLFLLLGGQAFAQDWRGLLRSTDQDLRSGHYQHARKVSIKLINSMMDNLNRGESAMYTFGLTVAYRAVAEAGLQRYDEADWYWHVARCLYPAFATDFDLTPYGEAGTWLAKRTCQAADTGNSSPSQRPVCINRREPTYPVGAVVGGVAEPIMIRVLIDRDGSVRHPALASATSAPTLVYAATEAVKDWQFQPASVDGKPCPMQFDLTVNFAPPAK
jgi:TonB family protein